MLFEDGQVAQNRAMKGKMTEIYEIRNDRPDFLQAIGSRIRTARLDMGSSVEAFATNSGLTPTQLSHIEQGLLRITAVQLCDAAEHSKRPISYFFSEPELVPSADQSGGNVN
jgi:hypothetical protein